MQPDCVVNIALQIGRAGFARPFIAIFSGRRTIRKSRITRLVTVSVIITAALIATYEVGGSIITAIFTRAGLLENVRNGKTLTWKVIFPKDETAIIRGMAIEPYYIRVELPDGKIWLLDRRERKVILMNPVKKTAKIMDMKRELSDVYDSVRYFKNMPEFSIERIGQRRIGQKQAIGFHLKNDKENDERNVWIDSQSRLPIRIEFFEVNELGQMEPKFIWDDIVFDVELDESIFKFAAEEYNLETYAFSGPL